MLYVNNQKLVNHILRRVMSFIDAAYITVNDDYMVSEELDILYEETASLVDGIIRNPNYLSDKIFCEIEDAIVTFAPFSNDNYEDIIEVLNELYDDAVI